MNACEVDGGRAFAFCKPPPFAYYRLCCFCANVTAAPLEGTMGDGKVRILDLACRGGALDDRISAVCKQAASSI